MSFVSNFKSLALLLMPGLLAAFPVYAGNINVEYDQQQDRIRIQAANASLTSVLAEIANKTGMEIQIDPAVEKTVNFQLPPQALQQALQKVVKGLSYVIEYGTNEQERIVVSGLRLLPKGKQDSGQLVPVAVLNARASRSGGGGDRDYGGSLNRRGSHQTTIIKPDPPAKKLPENMDEVELDAQPTYVSPAKQKGKLSHQSQESISNMRPNDGSADSEPTDTEIVD